MGTPLFDSLTIIATLLAAGGTAFAAFQAKRAADAARASVEANRRPKLHVRLIEHKDAKGVPHLWVAVENCGDAPAIIEESDLYCLPRDRRRGIRQEWHDHARHNPVGTERIQAGEVFDWKIPYEQPADYSIAVEGRILYRKEKGGRVFRTLFCRFYDPTTGRYHALKNDPEHERED